MTITIDDPRVTCQPFPVQVERGEEEAFGLHVGSRTMRLARTVNPWGGADIWMCFPHNENRFSEFSGSADNPTDAVVNAFL